MMISPNVYYDMNIKDRSFEEITAEVERLEKEIKRLEADIASGKPDLFMPSAETRLVCTREYLKVAKEALK